ncbi:hypothetical protein E4U55_007185 [Claviceps digitariae]|nr:hypothetical protein E4U55_007185 [Claviceps digitariae]
MFANTGAAAGGAILGPELETIQVENFGFSPLAGEAKVRLTSSWTSPPSDTASLLSVASRKGLVAAAGPDQIIIATTESVRKAFASPREGDSEIRSFQPQLRIPAPTRISHVAFTADEKYLIMSAESGGGLAVYDVESLAQGSTNPAFELPTNGESIRLLAPNPAVEKAELCAVVTTSGNLCMVNLNERNLQNSLKTQVSCLSWSARGKQLCAGISDGTICQMTPEGQVKADIPRPPNSATSYVTSLTWLENNVFLAIYAVANVSPTSSVYYLITRDVPSSTYAFQKLADPVEPFGAEKQPHHSILRLRDLEDLQDVLIVSSTASTEIGLLTRSTKPLAKDKPPQSITNVFTMTEILQDMRRPALPMTESMEDSVAVGTSLDLSSKEIVYKPIPSNDELDHSSGPLPGLWVLTREGILCSWWLVYDDAVKSGRTYSGLSVMDNTAAPATRIASQTTPIKPTNPFAGPSTTSPFGPSTTPTSTPAFGSSTQLGQKASLWGGSATTSAATTGGAVFGSSSFGTSTTGLGSGAAFGKPSTLSFAQAAQLGPHTSPWAPSGGSKPVFGQSGFSSFANAGSNQLPFSSAAFNSSSSGTTPVAPENKFSSFSTQGGFASLGANTNSAGGFGSGSKFGQSSFGAPDTPAPSSGLGFPDNQEKTTSVFGTTPFKIESSFKADPSQKDSIDKSSGMRGSTMFGSAFGSALGEAADKRGDAMPATEDDDMDTAESTEQTPQSKQQPFFAAQQSQESTTPTTTPAPSRFGFATSSTPGTSLFGQPSKMESSTSNPFGTPKDTPKAGGYGVFGTPQPSLLPAAEPKIKREEEDVPLPPDTTSKVAYPVGDSSSSSANSNRSQLLAASSTPVKTTSTTELSSDSTTPKPSDAQLPPDFTTTADESAEGSSSPGFLKIVKTKKMEEDESLPSDVTKATSEDAKVSPNDATSKVTSSSSAEEATPLPSKSVLPEGTSKESGDAPSFPEFAEDDDDDSFLYEDEASEGSGVDVAKDLSPGTSGLNMSTAFSPESSFAGPAGTTPAAARPEDRARPLFGEISRHAPLFPKPDHATPRSPSPLRGAVPDRVMRADATRSVSAPGMGSQIVGASKSQMQPGAESTVMLQQRRLRERQEAEETQPLVDEEDDEMQKVLATEVEGTLHLDEFIAHSNVVPPARESIPAQVEAVYRDVNSMIDTVGLNARSVKAFIKGHKENAAEAGRDKDDLEIPDDWVLCEIDDLGNLLDDELHEDLEDGRVRDLEDKVEACQELWRDMQRLRAKQEDLKRVMMAKMDPDQAEYARTLPLSAEQAAQQNELRLQYANFTKLLTQAEEALTILKTRIATVASSSGRLGANVPTVEAIMRTISKMTSMAEKRSGDIDVLETQLRKMKIGPDSREGSPMVVTPQGRRSIMMSPDSTPSRNFRQSLVLSSSVVSLGGAGRATPPRKKLSGFSKEEKGDLMDKRNRRQTVLSKLKESVGKRGVSVWGMEDVD